MNNETEINSVSNHTDLDNDDYYNTLWRFLVVFDWTVVTIGLFLILVSIVGIFSLIRKDNVAPIYIINLLVSDIIQLCCIAAGKTTNIYGLFEPYYLYEILVSVGFMVCIAMERYLIIAWPLWYRFRRNIKTSLLVCAVVWILPLLYYLLPVALHHVWNTFWIINLLVAIFLLLPFPLLVFFLVGTIRALSAARSVPADEKRRIVAILVTVLLIYTLLFLPYIILIIFVLNSSYNVYLHFTAFILLKISPLADLIMYFLIRKGSSDKLLAALCCGKTCWNQETSGQNTEMSASCSQNI